MMICSCLSRDRGISERLLLHKTWEAASHTQSQAAVPRQHAWQGRHCRRAETEEEAGQGSIPGRPGVPMRGALNAGKGPGKVPGRPRGPIGSRGPLTPGVCGTCSTGNNEMLPLGDGL